MNSSALDYGKFINKIELSQAATPRLLKHRPVHRWFYFPHSFSPELVEAILDEWHLPEGSWLLDPFVGAGTTLVVARERNYSAIGLDLLPLAVLVSNAKVADYNPAVLLNNLEQLIQKASPVKVTAAPKRLRKAFTDSELAVLTGLQEAIRTFGEPERSFFLTALMRIASLFSRAVADGGWLRWIDRPQDQSGQIVLSFREQVINMLEDLHSSRNRPRFVQKAFIRDARALYKLPYTFDALITSPPYPNRHDYTRIFHIEHLLLGYAEEHVKKLRYSSLRSHVEAHPFEQNIKGFKKPELLQHCLDALPKDSDPRIKTLLDGYFEDLYLVLRAARQKMKSMGRMAFVVGNVRYAGVLIPVDEILASIGESIGLTWEKTWVIRFRGNSAQQMGRYGRIPARESVVFFRCS